MGDKLKRWQAYLLEVFDLKRLPKLFLESSNVLLKILRSEIVFDLETMKPDKAAGPDQISIELIKLLDDDIINILQDLFNGYFQ